MATKLFPDHALKRLKVMASFLAEFTTGVRSFFLSALISLQSPVSAHMFLRFRESSVSSPFSITFAVPLPPRQVHMQSL